MPKFTFDMTLTAAISVDAPDAETAKRWLIEALDCADTNFGAYPNGDPILGEVSLNGEENITLGMIEGEDVEGARTLVDPKALTDRTMFDLLCENFDAWDGEEESVKEEHADLIEKTEAFIDAAKPRYYPAAG